jgi:hypothetical protein
MNMKVWLLRKLGIRRHTADWNIGCIMLIDPTSLRHFLDDHWMLLQWIWEHWPSCDIYEAGR